MNENTICPLCKKKVKIKHFLYYTVKNYKKWININAATHNFEDTEDYIIRIEEVKRLRLYLNCETKGKR